MSTGENIRNYRKAKGYTQKELAKISTVSEISIRKYENNDRTPKPVQIEKIASALEVSPFQLMGAEYFDLKYPELAEAEKKYQDFVSYIRSLGYAILEYDVSANDGCECYIKVYKDGITAIFTDSEFQALQDKSRENIDGLILLQQQKNKKEPPPAATESDSE